MKQYLRNLYDLPDAEFGDFDAARARVAQLTGFDPEVGDRVLGPFTHYTPMTACQVTFLVADDAVIVSVSATCRGCGRETLEDVRGEDVAAAYARMRAVVAVPSRTAVGRLASRVFGCPCRGY